MARVNLTDRKIKSLKTDRVQEDFWDVNLPGFGVRITSKGMKTFCIMYRVNGRKVRHTLRAYPSTSLADARALAKKALAEAADGKDPHARKLAERKAETFQELAEEYLERHAKKRKKSWKEDERKIRKELLPHWGIRKAKDISRRDVNRLVESIADRGSGITANRTLALISKIFNYGIDNEIIEVNPAQRVKPPTKERSRDRVLKEDEIRELWTSLSELHPVVASSFKMRFLTAQRGLEVLSMRWRDIDGEWWTIPAEISKNGLPHRVPLSPQSVTVLEELQPLTGSSEWVFASPKKKGARLTVIRKAAKRLAESSGVDFKPHDLRRTAATQMASMGVSRLVVGRILNHAERGVTAIYDRATYDNDKRQALIRWGDKLKSIVSGKTELAEVVRIG